MIGSWIADSAERDRLHPGKPVAAAGAAEEDRELVPASSSG